MLWFAPQEGVITPEFFRRFDPRRNSASAEGHFLDTGLSARRLSWLPEQEAAEVADVFRSCGLEDDNVTTAMKSTCANKKRWVDFMMRLEWTLEEPAPTRARNSALTVALSYIAGGMVPLAPYFFFRSVHTAIIESVAVTLLALLVFGYIKGQFTTARPFRSAWQTAVVDGLAATAAFVIAKAIA